MKYFSTPMKDMRDQIFIISKHETPNFILQKPYGSEKYIKKYIDFASKYFSFPGI